MLVTDSGRPIDQLNELEFVNGEIYANVRFTSRIAIITRLRRVTGWVDLAGLDARRIQRCWCRSKWDRIRPRVIGSL